HPGETSGPITIVFRNTGSQTWQRGSAHQANLGVSNDDTSWGSLGLGWLSPNRPAGQSEDAVTPGGTATFTFRVVAPLAPGAYELHLRPDIDGVNCIAEGGGHVS